MCLLRGTSRLFACTAAFPNGSCSAHLGGGATAFQGGVDVAANFRGAFTLIRAVDIGVRMRPLKHLSFILFSTQTVNC
jgi:hypothetical protein